MSKPLIKLYIVFAAFVVNLFLIPIIGKYANHLVGYSLFTLFVVLLPLYVLFSKDALVHIASTTNIGASQKVLAWVIACIPAFTFGLLATGFGAAIIVWVLYNYLIERQPEFTVPVVFGSFGIAPAMLFFGIYTLKSLWVRRKNA